LEHPNLCTVYSLEEDDQHGHVLVMDYIPGETLWQYAHTIPPTKLEPAEIMQILVPIADALDYLHSKGIIHRDITHEHIMITVQYGSNRRLIPKLIDFGLAMRIQDSISMTRASKMMSTEWYKSPEQWLGTQLDARTDQYMFGVVAYELLACALPFDDKGVSINALMSLVVNSPVPPIAEYNDTVNAVLAKALAKEGKDRFDDCRSFIAALAKAIGI
jgi:serine/threonine-protein kinase